MQQHMTTTADPKINWPAPPALWSLGSRDAHVWAATTLAQSAEGISRFSKALSPDELDRAGQNLSLTQDRWRFSSIAGRGLLRDVLGQYLAPETSPAVF